MKVTVLGSGGPESDSKRTSSSVFVEVANTKLLFDCGPGASLRLAQSENSSKNIDALFITHLHMDHSLELPAVIFSSYLDGRSEPFPIYGPPGLQKFSNTMFNDLFKYLGILVQNVMKREMIVECHEINPGIINLGRGVSVEAKEVKHGNIIAYGYKITENSKSVVISGDTEPCDAILNMAKGANILLHDCAFPDEGGHVPGHTIPKELSEIAEKCSPGKIVMTHLFKATKGKESQMIESVKKRYDGTVIIANDLDTFEF